MNIIKEIVLLIRDNTEWLYTIIYQNKIFFIDLWSILHFLSGMLFIALICWISNKKIWLKLLLILLSYEIIEISLYFFSLEIFLPEILKDQVTDIFIGLLGGVFYYYFIKSYNERLLNYLVMIVSVFFVSFIWVGSYSYKYNVEIFNTSGINIWAFILWFCAGLLVLFGYKFFFNSYKSKIKKISIIYLFYLISLFILEILGQYIFSIHEISKSDSKALIFDLIHGTRVLHIFYLSAPFILISTYKIFYLISYKSYKKVNDSSKMSLVLPEILTSRKNSLSI
mgnify:CR=1 FL=1